MTEINTPIIDADEMSKLINSVEKTLISKPISVEDIIKCIPLIGDIASIGISAHDILMKQLAQNQPAELLGSDIE